MLALDSKAWVERQFSDANLGDQRRQKRLAVIAQNMLNQPENLFRRRTSNGRTSRPRTDSLIARM